MNIVIWPQRPDWEPAVRKAAGSATVVAPSTEAEALAAAPNADGWVGKLNPQLLAAATKLRWTQSPTISLEHVVFPELIASDVVLTNMRHTGNFAVSTHATMFLLALCRDIPHLYRQQQAGVWKREADIRDLTEMTVLVQGLGGIGKQLIKQLVPHGPKIIGVDPLVTTAPEGVSTLAHPDKLDELIPQADAVICIAPLTPETMGSYDEARFKKFKKGALFINVGRGQIVITDALLKALDEGWIARAAIDVSDPEPLPAGHPLWKSEKIMITPHLATLGSKNAERQLACVVDNVARFVSGKPFETVADKARWF